MEGSVYYPKELVKAKENIVKVQAKRRRIGERNSVKEVRSLMKKIGSLTQEELKSFAFSLNQREIILLSRELPRNTMDVDFANLLFVLEKRMNSHTLSVMYLQWQNYCDRKENAKLFVFIAEHGKFHDEFTRQFLIEPFSIKEAILENSLGKLYREQIADEDCFELGKYKRALKRIGVNIRSKLAKMCIDQFYYSCSAEEYCMIGEKKLMEVLKRSKSEEEKLLLFNMLETLSGIQLDQFFLIVDYFSLKTGELGTVQYNNFFKNIKKELIQKYHEWMNRWNINRVFSSDHGKERSQFWNNYSQQAHVSYIEATECLVFEIKELVFLEFQEIGPIYQYTRNYYEQEVKEKVHKITKETELKSWLYHHSNYELRRVHTGHWQDELSDRIS